MQRLREQHVAELPRIHLNRRSGIEGTPDALRDGLIADATDARGDLPGPCLTSQPDLQGLHAPAQCTPNKDGPEESPIMIIDAAREASQDRKSTRLNSSHVASSYDV